MIRRTNGDSSIGEALVDRAIAAEVEVARLDNQVSDLRKELAALRKENRRLTAQLETVAASEAGTP